MHSWTKTLWNFWVEQEPDKVFKDHNDKIVEFPEVDLDEDEEFFLWTCKKPFYPIPGWCRAEDLPRYR
eukprot:UN10201